MAAADYFHPGGGLSTPSYPPPPPQNGTAPSHNPPYPMSDAPPPYSAFPYADTRPHSQPPPQQRPPPPDDIYRPAPRPANSYMPERSSRTPYQMNDYQYQQPSSSYQQQPYNQKPYYQQQQGGGYSGSPNGPSAVQPIYRDDRKPSAGQPQERYRSKSRSRSRSRSRDRDRSRDRHRKHHNRPQPSRKKSSGVNTFLGAGGGALVGDMIFPGLGTLGGALLGGIGGHEIGKKRASSNPNQRRHRSYSNDFDYGNYDDGYRREEDRNRRGRKY